ncbi:MAG: hypothetical protein ACTSYO_02625 [Candidatus Ranarchaeia archaeon]
MRRKLKDRIRIVHLFLDQDNGTMFDDLWLRELPPNKLSGFLRPLFRDDVTTHTQRKGDELWEPLYADPSPLSVPLPEREVEDV